MEERQHHLRESSSAGGVRSWRFCRAPIVRVWTPTFAGAYIFCRPRRFQRPPCYCRILWNANILDVAQIFWIGANVMDANISWAQTFQTFHGREYFMDANILRCLDWKQIFCVNYYFRQAPIFNDFAVSSTQFLFCNKFCFDFLLLIFVYIFSIYLCMLCAPIFLAQIFWNPGLRLM